MVHTRRGAKEVYIRSPSASSCTTCPVSLALQGVLYTVNPQYTFFE